MMTVYEELAVLIRELSQSQVRILLETARRLQQEQDDKANDPLIGLFSGHADLSSRSPDWTQKSENV